MSKIRVYHETLCYYLYYFKHDRNKTLCQQRNKITYSQSTYALINMIKDNNIQDDNSTITDWRTIWVPSFVKKILPKLNKQLKFIINKDKWKNTITRNKDDKQRRDFRPHTIFSCVFAIRYSYVLQRMLRYFVGTVHSCLW